MPDQGVLQGADDTGTSRDQHATQPGPEGIGNRNIFYFKETYCQRNGNMRAPFGKYYKGDTR